MRNSFKNGSSHHVLKTLFPRISPPPYFVLNQPKRFSKPFPTLQPSRPVLPLSRPFSQPLFSSPFRSYSLLPLPSSASIFSRDFSFPSSLLSTRSILILLPLLSVISLYGYIYYRSFTKPLPSIPPTLVSQNGELLDKNGNIIALHPLSLVLRFFYLFSLYFPLLCLYVCCWPWNVSYTLWQRLFLFALQHSGPAAIKAGQWACTREDLFSPELRNTLTVLYSEARTHDGEQSIVIIEKELGSSLSSYFTKFEKNPIGSGAIGQAHVAIWKPDGRKVVVKVMHPGCVETLARDIYLVNVVARTLHGCFSSLQKWYLPETAMAWSNLLASQLDFRVEADNLTQFRANFAHVPEIHFPEPLHSTRQVLVETFAPGHHATPERLQHLPKHTKDVLAHIGMNAFCQMLLRDNFIHCDLHPGNILLDTSDLNSPTVTLLDVGLVHHLSSEREADLVQRLVAGFCYWKPQEIAETLYAMGTPQWASQDVFVRDLSQILATYRPNGQVGEYAVLGDVLESVFGVIRTHHVHLDACFVTMLFSVLLCEGFLMTLNPCFNVAHSAAPWLVTEGHVSFRVWRNLARHAWRRVQNYVGSTHVVG